MATVRGDKDIIDLLNRVLTNELTAINQYFLHSRMQRNWGYRRLAEHYYHESIDEMRHADQLIERILYLDGLPNLQRLHTLKIGETVQEQLETDRGEEDSAVAVLREGIALCRSKNDVGSAVLLEKILVSEEEHIDWLDAQLALVAQLGVTNYLTQQIHED